MTPMQLGPYVIVAAGIVSFPFLMMAMALMDFIKVVRDLAQDIRAAYYNHNNR